MCSKPKVPKVEVPEWKPQRIEDLYTPRRKALGTRVGGRTGLSALKIDLNPALSLSGLGIPLE